MEILHDSVFQVIPLPHTYICYSTTFQLGHPAMSVHIWAFLMTLAVP